MRWPFARRRPQPEREVALGVDSLLAFVRAGGGVTLAQWTMLDADTQAALERAGTAVRAEWALAIAAALTGGAEVVSAAVDGGTEADESAIGRALDRASSLLRRAPA